MRSPIPWPDMRSPMPSSTQLTWVLAGWCVAFIATLAAYVITEVLLAVLSDSDPSSGQLRVEDLSLGWQMLLQAPLWAGFVGAPLLARRYGLRWGEQLGWQMRASDVPLGMAAAVVTQLSLVLLYVPIFWIFGDLDVEEPARALTERARSDFDVGMLALTTIVAAPITEELFFRGFLQGALGGRMRPVWALLIASTAFAAVHFQVVQFPALLLVGIVNGLLVLRTGRLGAAIWSHATFNTVTVVTLLG